MNAHQRKKLACEKHRRMPLGSDVLVRKVFPSSGEEVFLKAKISKHDSARPNMCIVVFEDESSSWVSLYNVKPTLRLNVRPWWRVLKDKTRAAKATLKNQIERELT